VSGSSCARADDSIFLKKGHPGGLLGSASHELSSSDVRRSGEPNWGMPWSGFRTALQVGRARRRARRISRVKSMRGARWAGSPRLATDVRGFEWVAVVAQRANVATYAHSQAATRWSGFRRHRVVPDYDHELIPALTTHSPQARDGRVRDWFTAGSSTRMRRARRSRRGGGGALAHPGRITLARDRRLVPRIKPRRRRKPGRNDSLCVCGRYANGTMACGAHVAE